MKYMLLMQFPLSAARTERMELWPPQDIKAHMEYLRAMRKDLIDAGEMVGTEGLMGPEQAKEVHARSDGTAAVTDGPFPESKEFLAGYLMVDVDDPQRAYAIAARWSAGPGPGGKPLNLPVQVRQVMSGQFKSAE
jgi:hypothetical protein